MPYLLIAVPALAILFLVFWYASWEEWDDYRRFERKAHRNLMEQTGAWKR